MQDLFIRHPTLSLAAGAIVFSLVTAMLLAVDAFSPEVLPLSFSSNQQLLGANLLLMLIPTYLAMGWGLLQHRSGILLAKIDEQHPGHDYRSRLATPARHLIIGGGAGGIYGVSFNLPVGSLNEFLNGGPLTICIVLGMIFLWLCAGLVLASRLYVSGLFSKAGEAVPLEPYDLARLEPFARMGMSDMLMTVGAVALSVVQSIDATFRLENYLFALAVAVPATLLLLLRPMSRVHARLKAFKASELAAINALIGNAPKTLAPDAVAALESLLQRRDRVRALSTWPLNTAMISRLIIYGIIPPVAWFAAAVVEFLVTDALSG
jgi:hypothetical protein